MRNCVCEEKRLLLERAVLFVMSQRSPGGDYVTVSSMRSTRFLQNLHRLKSEEKTFQNPPPPSKKKKKSLLASRQRFSSESFTSCLRETGSRSSSHSSPLVSNRVQGLLDQTVAQRSGKHPVLTKKKHEKSLFWENEMAAFLFLSEPQIEQLHETALILNGCRVSLSRPVLSGQERLQSFLTQKNVFRVYEKNRLLTVFIVDPWFCTCLSYFLYSILFYSIALWNGR